MTDQTLREKIEALVASAKDDGDVMFNRAIYQVLDIFDAHTAAQPAPDAVAGAHECPLYGPPWDCAGKQCYLCQRSKP